MIQETIPTVDLTGAAPTATGDESVTDADLSRLGKPGAFPKLETLHLDGCEKVTARAWRRCGRPGRSSTSGGTGTEANPSPAASAPEPSAGPVP